MATCIQRDCGKTFDPRVSETRDTTTLRSFWQRYCPEHRTGGNAGTPVIVEQPSTPDFTVQNEGTIYLLTPHTNSAKFWVREHLSVEVWQRFGNAIAVEHGYIADIVRGIQRDGLEVR